MNLINCAQNCAFQKEGYCTLNTPSTISAVPVGGCCYFKAIIAPIKADVNSEEKQNNSNY